MYEKIFELLQDAGFDEGKIEKETAKHRNYSELFEKLVFPLIAEIENVSEIKGETNGARFDFYANEELSGQGGLCISPECRLQKLDELIQFASLYADIVYINNPFVFLLDTETPNENDIRKIITGIISLWKIKPLLESGIIRFTSSRVMMCKDCNRKISLQQFENLEKVERYLLAKFKQDLSFVFTDNGEKGFVQIIGTEDIVGHPSHYVHFTKHTPKVFKKHKGKIGVPVGFEDIESAGVIDALLGPVIDDFLLQDWHTRIGKMNYLTNRSLDIQLIRALSNEEIAKKNLAHSSLLHSLTYFENAAPEDIIKIRIQEAQSFELYRRSIEQFKAETLNVSPERYKEAFEDLVRTNMLSLDLKLKAYKVEKLRNTRKKIIINTGILTIGLYTGILPNNLREVLGLVGGLQICESLLTELSSMQEAPAEIMSDPYYFLWRTQKQHI